VSQQRERGRVLGCAELYISFAIAQSRIGCFGSVLADRNCEVDESRASHGSAEEFLNFGQKKRGTNGANLDNLRPNFGPNAIFLLSLFLAFLDFWPFLVFLVFLVFFLFLFFAFAFFFGPLF